MPCVHMPAGGLQLQHADLAIADVKLGSEPASHRLLPGQHVAAPIPCVHMATGAM